MKLAFIRHPPGATTLLARNEHSNVGAQGGCLPNLMQKMGDRKK